MKCVVCGKDLTEDRIKKSKVTCSRSCSASLGNKKRWSDLEARKAMSIKMKESYATSDAKEKISIALKNAYNSTDLRKRRSEISKRVFSDDSIRKKVKESNKAFWTKERRESFSSFCKEKRKDPAYRQKVSQGVRKSLQNPKVIKNREAAKASLEYRAKLSSSLKNSWSDESIKQQRLQHRREVMRQNNTNKRSGEEDTSYILLKELFDKNDIIRWYSEDERYPFECDFYIKSLDMFIECNYFWTHYKEPFNENNDEHLQILSTMKQKAITSKKWQEAIDTWTIRDVKKFTYAKMNNLNYRVFYSLRDFKQNYKRLYENI